MIDILSETEAFSKHFLVSDGTNEVDPMSLNKDLVYIYKSCSVADHDLLKQAMQEIKHEFGSMDIVINAAGITNELNPQKVIDINFVSYPCCFLRFY